MVRQSHLLPLVLALSAAPLAASAAPTYVYDVTQLAGFGGSASFSKGINNAGQVAGFAYTPGNLTHAYVGTGAGVSDLHPAGASTSSANAINNGGTAAGEVVRQGGTRAAVFSGGGVTELGTLGGNYSSANGINAAGQVVGTAALSDGTRHAFLAQGGSLTDLGALIAGAGSVANAINDNGIITGYSEVDGDGNYHAIVYMNGRMTDIGTLGGSYSEGYAVNNAGAIAGYAGVAGDAASHAFVYANGTMIDLGTLGGDSFATDINESGDVVGGFTDSATGQQHAFVYSGGLMRDLNALVDLGAGWTLNAAMGINDQGQIAASGCRAGGGCASFLLTLADTGGGEPVDVPEPEAFTAGIAGLALCGLLRRRRKLG